MKKLILKYSILLFYLFIIGCSNNEDDLIYYNATVLGEGINCTGTYVIKFDEDTEGLVNDNFDGHYYALNLPEEYKVDNLEIKVSFRQPRTNEYIVECAIVGPGYPYIYILGIQ